MCRKHSRIFTRQLRRYKMWALQMWDSSAKLPSGLLSGNANQLGDFDQCLDINVFLKVTRPVPELGLLNIKGKYCLVSVELSVDKTVGRGGLREAVNRATALGFIKSKLHDVEPEMCTVRKEVKLPMATICVLCFFASIIFISIIATLKEKWNTDDETSKGKFERILLAFSLSRNWVRLTEKSPDTAQIDCIHGIRSICTLALYLAHSVIPLALTAYVNRDHLTELSNEPWSIIFRASLIYTDAFLLLSGVLTAYNMSSELEIKGSIRAFKRYVARFIRLVPALLATILFYGHVWEYLGEGPLWNRVVKKNSELCRQNGWRNIFFIQNFFTFEEMCATHTHQLALDFQLFLTAPFLVSILIHHQLVGFILLAVLLGWSSWLRYSTTLAHNLSLVIYHGMTLGKLYKTANLSYALSTHRATPYLIGVALGVILYRTRKEIHIPKIVQWIAWPLNASLVLLMLWSQSHLADRTYRYTAFGAAIYAAFSPLVWSITLAWVVFACSTGNGGFLNKWLCHRLFLFISRISYSFYLIQFIVFFYNVGSLKYPEEFTFFSSIDPSQIITIIILSTIFSLLFDLPMQDIKTIITESKAKKSLDKNGLQPPNGEDENTEEVETVEQDEEVEVFLIKKKSVEENEEEENKEEEEDEDEEEEEEEEKKEDEEPLINKEEDDEKETDKNDEEEKDGGSSIWDDEEPLPNYFNQRLSIGGEKFTRTPFD